MKLLALLLTLVFLSPAAFASRRNRAIGPENSNPYNAYFAPQKVEKTSHGVKFDLEITGSDRDGYTVRAANESGETRDCFVQFQLAGKSDDGRERTVDFKKTGKLRDTDKSWFQWAGEAGMKIDGVSVKELKFSDFEVGCDRS